MRLALVFRMLFKAFGFSFLQPRIPGCIPCMRKLGQSARN